MRRPAAVNVRSLLRRCEVKNDLPAGQMAQLLAMTPYPQTLRDIADTSRDAFGWFTRQQARSLEYPWIVEQAEEVSGKRVVDIGAGVSPVPLVLAARGAEVTTVDYMPPDARDMAKRDEWGFLDYATLSPRVRSINGNAAELDLGAAQWDIVMSISVVEHMPAAVRREVLRRAGQWLKPGGRLLLTVDLVPNSLALWNRDRGQPVEDGQAHGSLSDLETEIAASGIAVTRTEVVRWATGDRLTDLAFVRGLRDASQP